MPKVVQGINAGSKDVVKKTISKVKKEPVKPEADLDLKLVAIANRVTTPENETEVVSLELDINGTNNLEPVDFAGAIIGYLSEAKGQHYTIEFASEVAKIIISSVIR